ncbi:glycosyltransferase 87 family protein [Paracrocinitomix mangrovi]|uniref:glycosyltransferase 87 family protein n=1 Tax=Paracrocinitomix mangrovi TaxID=2862509 RepID=UPI001C8D4710|nr:glycosyltransferase 87 family protein [Paracrocinitomix mangrovi]UKN01661.1 glycosyltransferase 87 family protein [Paracrocinitomix mangrovi]
MKLILKALPYLQIIVLGLCIGLIGFETERENFLQFILLYLLAFQAFYYIWLNKQEWKFKHFVILAVAIRLVLIAAMPELSNDFFRFIWDGELMASGINPYAHTPNELISQGPIYSNPHMRMLFHGMGELSQANYTCYPVFNQMFFYIPAKMTDSIPAFVITLKLVMILADIGAIYIGKKILEHLNKPTHLIWIYALNPLVILEFTGNLHFEGVMIFFTLLAIYYVLIKKWLMGAVFLGIAVQIKLIPLMLLPFFMKHLKWRNSLGFVAMTGVVVLTVGAMMINAQFYNNFMQSIDLYFHSFQFNGSIAFLLKEITMATKGWDGIHFYGPFLKYLSLLGIVAVAAFKNYKGEQYLFTAMMFGITIYYALGTTVHPWYVTFILVLSIFTRYKFALVWSFMVMLSYAAYDNPEFRENGLLIIAEYVVVYGVMLYEIFKNTDKTNFALNLKTFFSN